MAYIGKEPIVGNFQVCDAISVVNGQAAYTMQVSSTNVVPESANHMLVSLNGILQKPNSSFTVSGSTITFASNLATGDVIDFIMLLGNVLDIGTPSDSTVTDAKTNFVSTSSAAGLQIKGDGTTDGTLQLNCSQNSHGIKLKSPAHSAGASYTLTFPTTDGNNEEFLQTNGSGVLTWAAAGGGITVASQWRVNNSPSGMNNNDIVGESGHGNWEQNDTQYSNIGSAMSVSNGVFTFPTTGIYLVSFKVSLYDATEQSYFGCNIDYTTDNSNFNGLAEAYTSLKLINNSTTFASTFALAMLDVTDTSNVKVRFRVRAENGGFEINGSSSANKTVATFIRLGDT